MPKFYPEALFFCVVWVALAVAAWAYVDMRAGLAMSVGLFLIVMPTSAITLSRTGNFAIERAIRWSILIVAALILFWISERA